MVEKPRLLNVKQVAALFQIHEKTIYKWLKKGLIPLPDKNWGSPRWDMEKLLKYVKEDHSKKDAVAESNAA